MPRDHAILALAADDDAGHWKVAAWDREVASGLRALRRASGVREALNLE
jgi:hypothetical protein